MKKCLRVFEIVLLCFILSLSFCACNVKEGEECDSPVAFSKPGHAYEPQTPPLNLNRTYEVEGITLYFSSHFENKDFKVGVESVQSVKEHHAVPSPVYLLREGATYLSEDGLYFNVQDGSAMLLAVLLESDAREPLPFGLFAGVATEILQDGAKMSDGKYLKLIQKYSYVADLQYPLYAAACTKQEERDIAWAYASKLGKLWFEEHTLGDLASASGEELSPLLSEIGAGRPAFYCPVGDYCYPMQFLTENFRYFLDPAFEDARLEKKFFSPDYASMKRYVLENEEIYIDLTERFQKYAEVPPPQEEEEQKTKPIDVFLGDFDLSPSLGYIDYKKEAICLKSVSVTIYMMTDFVLLNSVGLRQLRYGFCDYFNNLSSYIKPSYFDLYRLKTEGTNYERELLVSVKKSYEKKFKKADFENFKPVEYAECLAANLNERTDGKFVYMGQMSSFIKYVDENYGMKTLMDLDDDLQLSNTQMETDDLIEKWQDHLKKYVSE